MPNAYQFDNFIHACGEQGKAVLIGSSANDARMDFGLNTQQDVLSFIANDGLEDAFYINTKIWEKNPNQAHPIMVDAYSFYSGAKPGYLAFLLSPTNKWIIKSFKHSPNDPKRKLSPAHEALSEIKQLMSPSEDK